MESTIGHYVINALNTFVAVSDIIYKSQDVVMDCATSKLGALLLAKWLLVPKPSVVIEATFPTLFSKRWRAGLRRDKRIIVDWPWLSLSAENPTQTHLKPVPALVKNETASKTKCVGPCFYRWNVAVYFSDLSIAFLSVWCSECSPNFSYRCLCTYALFYLNGEVIFDANAKR